jgi:hypothetical protein
MNALGERPEPARRSADRLPLGRARSRSARSRLLRRRPRYFSRAGCSEVVRAAASRCVYRFDGSRRTVGKSLPPRDTSGQPRRTGRRRRPYLLAREAISTRAVVIILRPSLAGYLAAFAAPIGRGGYAQDRYKRGLQIRSSLQSTGPIQARSPDPLGAAQDEHLPQARHADRDARSVRCRPHGRVHALQAARATRLGPTRSYRGCGLPQRSAEATSRALATVRHLS